MTAIARLSRRTLMRLLALGVPGLLLGNPRADPALRTLEQAARQLVPDRRSAEAVGLAYLRAEPAEARLATRAGLMHLLPSATDVEPLVAALRAQTRSDFRNGDVVWVRGFLLARSEARLCAWIAIG